MQYRSCSYQEGIIVRRTIQKILNINACSGSSLRHTKMQILCKMISFPKKNFLVPPARLERGSRPKLSTKVLFYILQSSNLKSSYLYICVHATSTNPGLWVSRKCRKYVQNIKLFLANLHICILHLNFVSHIFMLTLLLQLHKAKRKLYIGYINYVIYKSTYTEIPISRLEFN